MADALEAWKKADACLSPMAARVERELGRMRLEIFMTFVRICASFQLGRLRMAFCVSVFRRFIVKLGACLIYVGFLWVMTGCTKHRKGAGLRSARQGLQAAESPELATIPFEGHSFPHTQTGLMWSFSETVERT